MLIRLLILGTLLLPASLRAQVTDFPPPPAGQVLDAGDRLGSERRARLEGELGRLRTQYHLDVMVILWDRSLPPETGLEELATRIGETWAREDLWAVVLHLPDSVHQPTLVIGGEYLKTIPGDSADDALHDAQFRGMKERTSFEQVAALGLEIGEELVYLKNRITLERKEYVANRDHLLRAQEERHQRMIFRGAVVTIVALVAVAVLAVLYLFRRRPSNLEFPATRWRRRLGAEWSGGGNIVVSIPSRMP
jgi:hypothetical protein